MRPQDIIADFLVRKKLIPADGDQRAPDEIAVQLIEALEAEGLAIDYSDEDYY